MQYSILNMHSLNTFDCDISWLMVALFWVFFQIVLKSKLMYFVSEK